MQKQYSLLLDVYEEYGKYTARALTSLTHRPGTPWSRFYEEGRNAIIPKEALKEALKEYKGTIVLVCHEKEFYEGLVDEIINLEDYSTKIV